MKKLLILTALICSSFLSFSQSGSWVWLKGDNMPNSGGNFGTMGVASPTNEPPARYQAAYWIDLQGDFWMYSGVNAGSDLWKYSPTTNNWTWVKDGGAGATYGTQGVPSPLNNPPALGYGANCWTDAAGDLWLYAGMDLSGFGVSDDLWKYHIATNEWTWMNGSGGFGNIANYGPIGVYGSAYSPGARSECKSGWVFSNKLWLFGGMEQSSATKNDIWSYDLSTNLWAWEGGGQLNNTVGNYGVKGVPAASNEPPARASYTKWQDAQNFYIFAGITDLSVSSDGVNDVWKFDKSTKLWTWIGGGNNINGLEVSNGYCDPDKNNIPSARFENQSAQTASTCINAFWTFGGFNFDLTKVHNDLWLFNTATLEWTKVKGEASTGAPVPQNYGVKGVPNINNLPPPRGGTAVWTDATGSLYVFGGYGYFNDLWKFIPDTACVQTGLVGSATLIAPNPSVICEGDSLHMQVPTNAIISISPSSGTLYDSANHVIHIFVSSQTTYTVIAQSVNANDPCFINDTISFTVTTVPNPVANFTLTPTTTTLQSPTFTMVNASTNATTYEWFDQNGNLVSTSIDFTKTESAIGNYCYTLVASNACGKKDSMTKCAEIVNGSYLVMPNAFSPNLDGKNDFILPIKIGDGQFKKYSYKVFNRWGMEVFSTNDLKVGWDGFFQGRLCPIGTFYYLIETIDPLDKSVMYKGDINLIY